MDRIELPCEKKVKHLTLIRESRTITPQEFNALAFAERLEMVRVSEPEFRFRLLIESKDGPRIMSRLSGQDVLLTLRGVGDEAMELLLPMISPEQFTFCLDLDCWTDDRLDAAAAREWFARLLDCSEEKIIQVVREMSFELLVLVLKKHVTVQHGPEDIDDEDVRIEAMRRDGGYAFSYRSAEDDKLFTNLFDILFRNDPGFFAYLVEASRGELDAMLEESVYRQRVDRMLDAGFPEPTESRSVYAWLDPDKFAGGELKRVMGPADPETPMPAFMLIEARPHDLLAAALARCLTPPMNWELACLANKVLLADAVDLADREAVQVALAGMYETLNLALQHASENRDDAVELLESRYLEDLFRYGHSLRIRLRSRAATLLQSAAGRFLDAPYTAFLLALQEKPHPLYAPGLDDPGEDHPRPFRSAHDLSSAERHLAGIDAQCRLFAGFLPFELPEDDTLDLAGCHPGRVADLSLSRLFLTALANRILGRDFVPDPIAAEELAGLHAAVCRSGRLNDALREETVAWAGSLVDGTAEFVNRCLDVWQTEFCPVAPETLDPRFVGGLIVRLDQGLR